MKIKGETIARTIALAIALINQILAVFGKQALPFAENDIYQMVTLFVTVATSGLAWWKNNSFTKSAIEADTYLESLREEG